MGSAPSLLLMAVGEGGRGPDSWPVPRCSPCPSSTFGCVDTRLGRWASGVMASSLQTALGPSSGEARRGCQPNLAQVQVVAEEENINSVAPTLCHSPALPAPDWPRGQARARWESAYSVPCKSAEPRASSSWLCPHLRPERRLRAYRWGIWQVTGQEALPSGGGGQQAPCQALSHTAVLAKTGARSSLSNRQRPVSGWGRAGAAPTSRGTSPGGRASSVYGPGPVKAETTPLERPHP